MAKEKGIQINRSKQSKQSFSLKIQLVTSVASCAKSVSVFSVASCEEVTRVGEEEFIQQEQTEGTEQVF